MKTASLLTVGLVMICLLACYQELTPLKPPAESTTITPVCKAPPIEQNIIGSWQCGETKSIPGDTVARSAPFTKDTFSRFGQLVFAVNKAVIDPDSLFENQIDGWGAVVSKTFSVETDTASYSPYKKYGELFWVTQYAKNYQGVTGRAQRYYFKVITNECNRIHLKGPEGALELVLIR